MSPAFATKDEEQVYELLREKVSEESERRGRGYLNQFDRGVGKPRQGWASKLINRTGPMFGVATLLAALRQLRLRPSAFFAEIEEKYGWTPPVSEDQAVEAFLQSLDASGRLREMVRAEVERLKRED